MDKEDVVHTHNGILLSPKKDRTMPFAATQMQLEMIILSEMSQKKTNTICYHLDGDSEKMNLPKKQKCSET